MLNYALRVNLTIAIVAMVPKLTTITNFTIDSANHTVADALIVVSIHFFLNLLLCYIIYFLIP